MTQTPQSSSTGASFGEDAERYARYRAAYPDAVFDCLAACLQPPHGVCVDLGAGTGLASLPLADRFDRVIAVEPDARMLAMLPPHPRIDRINCAAEALTLAPASVDAVVCATSFHWMDQQAVLASAHQWLRPGGVFFAFLQGPYQGVGPAADIIRRRRSDWLKWRDRSLGARADYGKAITASGLFAGTKAHSFGFQVTTSPMEAAGMLMTTSYVMASARGSGDVDAYRDAIAVELAEAGKVITLSAPLGGVSAIRA